MKTFKIVQQYGSVANLRKNTKMKNPIELGNFQAESITDAISKAAKEHGIAALLLHGTRID